jgi:serine/threonine protein kinase
MERLGEELSAENCTIDTLRDVLRIIQQVHQRKLLVIDIKPSNFLFGRHSNDKIYLIDLGLLERYVQYNGKHRPQKKSKVVSGTPMYQSIGCMKGYTPSRRDDLISFVYLYEDLMYGLPWKQSRQHEEIISWKEEFVPTDYNMEIFLEIVNNIDYSDEPPYDDLFDYV